MSGHDRNRQDRILEVWTGIVIMITGAGMTAAGVVTNMDILGGGGLLVATTGYVIAFRRNEARAQVRREKLRLEMMRRRYRATKSGHTALTKKSSYFTSPPQAGPDTR